MKTLSMLTASAALLGIPGCAPAITVNPGDTTPPALSVTLYGPSELSARYDGIPHEDVPGAIDPARSFQVYPRSDTRRVTLLFVARDDESGIGLLDARIDLTFTCVSGTPGSVPLDTMADFHEGWSGLAAGGTSVPPDRGTGTGFNLRDLWDRRCRSLGTSGMISDIQATYTARAENNSAPSRLPTTVTGRFTVWGGPVTVR